MRTGRVGSRGTLTMATHLKEIPARERVRHPLAGALVVAVTTLVALALAAVQPAWAGTLAMLGLGAVAGFALGEPTFLGRSGFDGGSTVSRHRATVPDRPGTPQYGLGLVAGAVICALVVVLVGFLVRLVLPWTAWALLTWAWFAMVAVRELGLMRFALPRNARLVPALVVRRRLRGSFGSGLEAGTGVQGRVTSGLPYVLLPAVALFGTLPGAVAAGLGFGLGRLLVTAAPGPGDDDPRADAAAHPLPVSVLLLVAFALALPVAMLAGGSAS